MHVCLIREMSIKCHILQAKHHYFWTECGLLRCISPSVFFTVGGQAWRKYCDMHSHNSAIPWSVFILGKYENDILITFSISSWSPNDIYGGEKNKNIFNIKGSPLLALTFKLHLLFVNNVLDHWSFSSSSSCHFNHFLVWLVHLLRFILFVSWAKFSENIFGCLTEVICQTN